MAHRQSTRLLALPLCYFIIVSLPVAAQGKTQLDHKNLNLSGQETEQELQKSILIQLQSEDSDERLKALQKLVELKQKSEFALPQLREILKQPVTSETAYVIRCLRFIGPEAAEAVPRLHEILKESVANQPDVVSLPLFALLSRTEPNVNMTLFETAMAIASMGTAGEVAIPTLMQMLKSPAKGEKRYLKPRTNNDFAPSAEGYAALLYRTDDNGTYTDSKDLYLMFVLGCLDKFGPAATEAIPAIRELENAPDTLPLVAQQAGELLEKIEQARADMQ